MVGRKTRIVPGPSVRHEYVPPKDERSALALGAVHMDANQAGFLAMADAAMRERRCAYPGCNKLRDDPIHEI